MPVRRQGEWKTRFRFQHANIWRLPSCLGLVLMLGFVFAQPVQAHGGEPHSLSELLTQWAFDPGVIIGLAVMGFLYVHGLGRIRARTGKLSRRRFWQSLAFAGGWLAIFVALVSPLDAFADQLFSVHMVQHILLMHVAAPLLALAYPLAPMLLALPASLRLSLGRWWNRDGVLRTLWNWLSAPVSVWVLYTLSLWVWHMPSFYSAAVENDAIHALEHLIFLGTSLLFWWKVVYYFGRWVNRRGLGILFVFTTALHSGVLGALITFSPTPWYTVYGTTAQALGLSPLADQQTAGLIMWIPDGVIYILAALILMRSWLSGLEQRESINSIYLSKSP